MTPLDLLKFNPCNLDHLTETYNIGFYLDYFRQWPSLCKVIEGPSGQIEAYSTNDSPLDFLQNRSLTPYLQSSGKWNHPQHLLP